MSIIVTGGAAVLKDALLNAATSAFNSGVARAFAPDPTPLSLGLNSPRKHIEASTDLDALVGGAVARLRPTIEQHPASSLERKLASAISAPETLALLQKHFRISVASKSQRAVGTASLRAAFRAWLSDTAGAEPGYSPEMADWLLDALLASCDRLLTTAIERGNLTALEARAAQRHHQLAESMSQIRAVLSEVANPKSGRADILAFEKLYRAEFIERHLFVTPPHLQEKRKVHIDKVFVAPRLSLPKEAQREPGRTGIAELLKTNSRIVVLGTPGGGKTTLLQHIGVVAATKYAQRPFVDRELTPVLVTLRDYAVANKERGLSILDHVTETARSTYQLEPPIGSFSYLLRAGRLLVLFDGLDELTDTNRRRKTADDIESFSRSYPDVRILATSREVGYDEAPLAQDLFPRHVLAPFDADQVAEYAGKFFSLDPLAVGLSADDKARAFVDESAQVADLRSNPLMLGLMCGIYRAEKYIPRNRPEVFRKCAEMLFEQWDRGRDIGPRIDFGLHFKPLLAHLAYWLYSNEALKGRATQTTLVQETTRYLLQRRYTDHDEASVAAEEWVRHCHGRAWVFTDTGTTADGEHLYQFTHRTFLEYFAAVQLTRIHRSADEMSQALGPRIDKREWDVVAQLAFHLLSVDADRAADALLQRLLPGVKPRKLSRAGRNRLSFAARALEFVVPSPAVAEAVASHVIRVILDDARNIVDEKERLDSEHDEISGLSIAPLLVCADENRTSVARVLRQLGASAAELDQEDAENIYELLLNLDVSLLSFSASTSTDGQSFWTGFSERFASEHRKELEERGRDSIDLTLDLIWDTQLDFDAALARFGPVLAFRARTYRVFNGVTRLPLSRVLLAHATEVRSYQLHREDLSRMLRATASALIANASPAMRYQDIVSDSSPWPMYPVQTLPREELTDYQTPRLRQSIEAADYLIVACAALDCEMSGNSQDLAQLIVPEKMPLAVVINARIQPSLLEAAQEAIASLTLTNGTRSLLNEWVRGRASFIDKPSVRGKGRGA